LVERLSFDEVRALGFDWPKYAVVEDHCVMEGALVDLGGTMASLQSSHAFYKRQLNEAYAFKRSTGADYSDFTDRFDEYAGKKHELDQTIAYLREIVAAARF
jgi:hypothetical protein